MKPPRAGPRRAGLRRRHDFEISVAAYPEVHPDALSPDADLELPAPDRARLLLGLTGELAVHGAPAMTLTQGHALFVGAGEPLTVGGHGEAVLVSSAHDRSGAAGGSAS